ncbi:MAG: asparagine synthase (glutamine-hydrolyzing) [Planctomycetaceae bacterium]|nr:asparagine synthase (glutamine-hydrolyzing) [Planctomycetaceae bacterium]
MCGIAGWACPDSCVKRSVLDAMSDAIAHRGPDGSGAWVSGDARVGLAHRRLAIVDLSAQANQPMVDAHGRATIVFNGEIYNHRELRQELQGQGATFRTDHSDTEVLLVGYLHWGLRALLERLNGMFAFGLYDHRQKKLLLARDRIGIKPLYSARVGRGMAFASEAKALLAHPEIPQRLNRRAFYHYLSFRSTPAPLTLFEGIDAVPAGQLVEFDVETGSRTEVQWWDPLEEAAAAPRSREAAEEQFEELLTSSVDYRMEADVPVSVFLSGGLDSAMTLALAGRNGRRLSSFTVTYPDQPEYNEGVAAAERARAAGANHHELPISAADFSDCLPDVAFHQDEPIAAPVCASVFLLSQEVQRTGNKVVLAGEGADELLTGYASWRRLRDMERWRRRLGHPAMRVPAKLASAMLGAAAPWRSHWLEASHRLALGQPLFWSGAMDFAERAKDALLGPGMRDCRGDTYAECIEPRWRRFCRMRSPEDSTLWMTYADLGFRLPQLMLPRLDKMGMAWGIEGRVPYLDHRLVEFVMGLPAQWRGGNDRVGKAMLRRIAARRLPAEFVRQRKRGFRAPVAEWKRDAVGERYGQLLVRFAERTELLRPEAVRALLAHRSSRLYFSLVNFMLWHERFIEPVLEADLSASGNRRSVAA